jgi:hypothetical protein
LGKGSIGREILPQELKRTISLFQATIYGIGLILGAGIYVIIDDVAAVVEMQCGFLLW